MSRTVLCKKLAKELPALEKPTYPGPLGERIFEEISKQAWSMWISHQTILINEYRLSLIDPEARKFLRQEMEKFLFGEGSEKPAAFSEPEKKV